MSCEASYEALKQLHDEMPSLHDQVPGLELDKMFSLDVDGNKQKWIDLFQKKTTKSPRRGLRFLENGGFKHCHAPQLNVTFPF